jgi:hypothetical protein
MAGDVHACLVTGRTRPQRGKRPFLRRRRHMICFTTFEAPDGTCRFVEVDTASPWNAPPPRPGEYTTEEEIQQILQHVDVEV